jgi:hypothetical protein
LPHKVISYEVAVIGRSGLHRPQHQSRILRRFNDHGWPASMLQTDVDYSQALVVIGRDADHPLRSHRQSVCFERVILRRARPVPALETVMAETFTADFMHRWDLWPTALGARNAKRTEGISFHEFLVRVGTGMRVS